ncbi:MAG: response regulator transcription factor [Lachnospiraceae bacterium]|nr:response regulator transcription factor [Lachnospiraceae bacterium]
MCKYKILVVEDDTDINNLLARILEKEGFEIHQAFSGTEAELRFSMEEYDLVLLDLMLPGMKGEDVLARIRRKSQAPVIVLSARVGLKTKVDVLNLGADDYLTKPFEKEEVVARVRAAVRRYVHFEGKKGAGKAEERAENPEYRHRDLRVSPDTREVWMKGREVVLTGHEYDILLLLIKNPGTVFSRERIYEQVWQGGYYGEDNTVNVHVSKIRRKLESAGAEEEYIRTVWGIGFKLV